MSEKFPVATTVNIIKYLENKYIAPAVIRRLKYQFKTREDKKFELTHLGKLQLFTRIDKAGVEDDTIRKVFTHFGFDTIKKEGEWY